MNHATDHTVDELLRSLADPSRRRLLRELREQQATTGRARISLTAVKAALDVPEERARIDLHHRHLPTLRAVGLIEHPRDGETDGGADAADPGLSETDILPGPQFQRAVPVLDAIRRSE
ncbi:MAG: hypothetical protein ABEI77_02270 [Halorientalis sp.]